MVREAGGRTLIVAFTDMQGRLMGKRVNGPAFLDGVIDHGAHICTYLLGTDMEMNTPDGFALMNWETGYGTDRSRSGSMRSCLAGEDRDRPPTPSTGDAGDPGLPARSSSGRWRPRPMGFTVKAGSSSSTTSSDSWADRRSWPARALRPYNGTTTSSRRPGEPLHRCSGTR
jgi:hypothetical protein